MTTHKEARAAWVAALRSGQYTQGRFKLFDGTHYTAIGVGCVVMGLEPQFNPSSQTYSFGSIGAVAWTPDEFMEWVGLRDMLGTNDAGRSLTYNNDVDRLSFAEIADIIESEPPGLFVD
jgi:hypothetical protein